MRVSSSLALAGEKLRSQGGVGGTLPGWGLECDLPEDIQDIRNLHVIGEVGKVGGPEGHGGQGRPWQLTIPPGRGVGEVWESWDRRFWSQGWLRLNQPHSLISSLHHTGTPGK